METRCPVLINFSGLKDSARNSLMQNEIQETPMAYFCEGSDCEGIIILKWILKAFGRQQWTGIIWLKIGTDTRLL
jgi:hypothetical protein